MSGDPSIWPRGTSQGLNEEFPSWWNTRLSEEFAFEFISSNTTIEDIEPEVVLKPKRSSVLVHAMSFCLAVWTVIVLVIGFLLGRLG